MIFRYSNQGTQFGRIPGGGLGCLLGLILVGVGGYYLLKGLYHLLWWAAPALIVLTLMINWRVIPDTFTRWLKTLETQPLTGIISAAFAVVAFPFFTLWLFLKALGARKLKQFEQEYSHKSEEPKEDFTEFEEIESTPLDKMPEPDIVEEPPAKEDKEPKDKENPYDSFFG